MNRPYDQDDIDQALWDDIYAEFSDRASKGDRQIFDFAGDYSDRFCDSAQAVLMGLMKVADNSVHDSALWARSARFALLEVMDREVAPEWCRTEYARRHQENAEMVEDWGMEESL